jgi:hypothetical protein
MRLLTRAADVIDDARFLNTKRRIVPYGEPTYESPQFEAYAAIVYEELQGAIGELNERLHVSLLSQDGQKS